MEQTGTRRRPSCKHGGHRSPGAAAKSSASTSAPPRAGGSPVPGDHRWRGACGARVVDNASTHNTPTIHCWLLRHPRFHVHFTPTNFTPTSRSWMNLVERWFAALTEKQPRRGAHRSTPRAGGGHSALHRHHKRAPEAVHVDEDGPIHDTRRGATKVAATMVAWSGLRIAMYDAIGPEPVSRRTRTSVGRPARRTRPSTASSLRCDAPSRSPSSRSACRPPRSHA
jgi:hypothetical protein